MQIIETMESTSAVPSRSSKRRNNGVMRNDDNSDDADPLATINGDYPDFVNSTRRRRTEKLKRNMAVLEENLDEEPNEPSRVDNDEPAITGEDLHRNEQIVAQMADVMKKLSTVNAFSNPLLDSLPKVIKTEPLQSVGTMLDASAKIYAFRVDHTHQECFIVRKDIGDEKELKKMKPERVEENDDQDITLQEAGPDKTIDENEPEEAIDENQPGPSKKSKKPKKLLPVVDEEKIKELQAEMGVTIRRFRRVLELEDEVSTESATKRFQFFADSVVERLGSRRELVTYLERSSEELEMEKEVHDLDEPYYHKATVGFEEGSAQSLLLKRVQSSLDGRFLLLHNKWRNMDFERLSQPPKSEEEEADGTENLDESVDAFCRNLQDRVADTADITIGNLIPLGDDIEDFDELLEESFPTTPAILRQRDVNDNEKTLRFEDNDQDDFDAGAPADEDDTLTFALQGEETVLDAPIGDVQELESIENEAHEKLGVDLGPPPLAGVLQEGQPPDQTVGEPRAVNEEPLDPGVQPVPDDSHWQNAPNAQEMAKKPDKKKRTESEALNDSGIAELSWEPEEEADKDLIERLNSLRLPQKPSNVAEKREKIITPIGDTYDLRDNENASYKPTDVLRMKLFYSSRNGYYRYRKKPIAPPIIWVSTASSGIHPKPEVNKDVDDYTEFLQVWADMTLEQDLNEHPAADVINLVSDVTFVPRTAENEHRNIDEDSLVDFNNDSFNHDSTLEEADIDFNATQNSAVHLDNMGRRSAELVLGNMGTPNDLDKTGMSTASNVKSQITNPNGTEQEYSDVEEVEINGMEIKIRPSRVKAIVVKKAMKKILSKNTEAKAIVRDGEEVVQDFSIQGSHSIGSLLAKLPDYLRGRTKRDINIVNAFSILLQMCNENNLFLHQDIGEDGMVTQKALSNFEICNSDPKMKASPCGKKRPFPVESPVDEIREQPHPSKSTNILI